MPIFMSAEENCNYIFQWSTVYACPLPGPAQAPCTAIDPATGDVYDLTPLIRNNSNWVAVDDSQANYYEYYINLCTALNPSPLLVGDCSSNSTAACQTLRATNQPVGKSLGTFSQPYVVDGTLIASFSDVSYYCT